VCGAAGADVIDTFSLDVRGAPFLTRRIVAKRFGNSLLDKDSMAVFVVVCS
jgi:hypothetical protein